MSTLPKKIPVICRICGKEYYVSRDFYEKHKDTSTYSFYCEECRNFLKTMMKKLP